MIEIIAAIIGLGGIALAYIVIKFSLREKTYEEALAEQRGGAVAPPAKLMKKEKPKKQKKKSQSDAGSEAGSPKTERSVSPQTSNTAESYADAMKAGTKDSDKTTVKVLNSRGARLEDSETSADETRAVNVKGPAQDVRTAQDIRGRKDQEKQQKDRQTKPSKQASHEEKTLKQAKEEKPVEPLEAHKEKDVPKKLVTETKVAHDEKGQKQAKDEKILEHVEPPKEKEVPKKQAADTKVRNVEKDQEKSDKSAAEIREEKAKATKQKTTTNPKEKAKKAPTAVNANGAGSEYGEISGLITLSHLSDEESKTLLYLLITKMSQRHQEWVQPGKNKVDDPATVARKMVEENRNRIEELEASGRSLSDQLKETKLKLKQESNQANQVAEYQQKYSKLETQLTSANQQIKQLQDKHAGDVSQWNYKVQESTNQARIFEEENQKLQKIMPQHPTGGDTVEMARELETLREECDTVSRDRNAERTKRLHLEELLEQKRVEEGLRGRNEDREEERQKLEQEVRRLKQTTETHVRDYSEVQESVKTLRSTVSEKDSRVQELSREIEDLKDRLEKVTQEKDKFDSAIRELKSAKSEVHAQSGEVDSLHGRVGELENDLKESRSKEKAVNDKLKQVRDEGFEEAKAYYEPQVADAEKLYREMLVRVVPDVRVEKSLKAGDWVAEFERSAAKNLRKSDDAASEVQSLHDELNAVKASQEAARSEAEKYRTTLQETESKLRELERSVESEEEKWELVEKKATDFETKCKDLQTRLSEVQNEKENASKLLAERSSSVSELEHRLKEAEDRLHNFASVERKLMNVEGETESLKQRLHETTRHKEELQSELQKLKENLTESDRVKTEYEERLDALLAEVNERRVSGGDTEEMKKEVYELRASLDDERENARKLAQEILRSKSLIQSGLEALRKEEETVFRLQQALQARQLGYNGTDGGGDRALDATVRSEDEEERKHMKMRLTKKKKSKSGFLKAFMCAS